MSAAALRCRSRQHSVRAVVRALNRHYIGLLKCTRDASTSVRVKRTGHMYYIYREFSYAAWIYILVFLLYWALVAWVRSMRRNQREFDVIQPPVEPPIQQNVEHHEDQP